jgi:hypothetical protein
VDVSPVFQVAFLISLLACCGYAFWFGGRAERLGVAIMLVASLASIPAMQVGDVPGWSAFKPGLAAVDVAVLAGFLIIALRSDRFWPLWVTSFQLIAVATHVAVLANPAVAGWVYSLAEPFWAYPTLIAATLGTIRWRPDPLNPRGRKRNS